MDRGAGLIRSYRAAWHAAGRGQWLLIVGFIFASRVLTFNVAFPLYAKARGFDSSQTGLMLAAVAISLFIFGAPLTILNTRGHGRKLFIAGPLTAALGITVILLTPGSLLPLMLAGCLLAGMDSNVFWTMGDPLLAGSTAREHRAQVFALKFALLTCGFALGGLIGGWVPEFLSLAGVSDTGMYAGALVVVLGLHLAQSWCYWRMPIEHPEQAAATLRTESDIPRFTGLAFWGVMLLMLVPEMGMSSGYAATRPYLSLFFDERFGLSPGATGTALSIMQLMGGVGALLIPSIARAHGSLRTMGGLRMLGGAMIAGAIGAPVVPVAILCLFVHYSVVDGTGATFVNEVMERLPAVQRTTFAAVSAGSWSLFSALSTSASGYLQDVSGFGAAFGLGAGAYFVSAAWLFFVYPRLPLLKAHPSPGATH
ncbi:MAG: MFS transporter [Thermomicrobiales bacterium]|nr:MFS transporter [Thermomicrobiales bacterium]